jgi:hypothetical protein
VSGRDTVIAVLDQHFIMWRDMTQPGGPPGEWFCSCGAKFGFSHTAVAHVAAALLASDWLAAHTAQRVAVAEQRGREYNADHDMCYVHGSEALAALVAGAKADERERIAAAIEAEIIPFDSRGAGVKRQVNVAHNAGCYKGARIARTTPPTTGRADGQEGGG